jgi:hypothetical protein
MAVELNRFNVECNLRPTRLAGRPFAALQREIEGAVAELARAAARHRGRAVMVGILPTLTPGDLQSEAMTDSARFRALSRALRAARDSEPFRVRIDGAEPLAISCDDLTFEGAATSFQVHWRVPPRRFADCYNAVQLATGPALAVAGNSPTFLGHDLWHETRVALFKQAVDDRSPEEKRAHRAPRVCFGTAWIERSAVEVFRESADLYPVLLPVLSDEDPGERLRAGRVPDLAEVRLHQGTVWRWNRPVYDPGGGGHLRIEMRALPSGPSVPDMLANAAFLVGLAADLAPEMETLCSGISFNRVHSNFYRAAQAGLDAGLYWPGAAAEGETAAARELLPGLLERAERGLAGLGVAASEAAGWLDVVRERVVSQQTGAQWQRLAVRQLAPGRTRAQALAAMLERYIEHSGAGMPVHTWPLPARGTRP